MIHLELDNISVYMEFKVCCIVVKTPKTLEIGMGIAKKYIAIQNHDMYHDTYHENIDSLSLRR